MSLKSKLQKEDLSMNSFKRQFTMHNQDVLDEILGKTSDENKVVFTAYGEHHKTTEEDLPIFNWSEYKMKLYFALNQKRYKHNAIKLNFDDLCELAGIKEECFSFGECDDIDRLLNSVYEKKFEKHLMKVNRSLLELCLQGHIAIKLPFELPMYAMDRIYNEGLYNLQMQIHLLSYHEKSQDFVFKDTKHIPYAYIEEWNKHFKSQISDRYIRVLKEQEELEAYTPPDDYFEYIEDPDKFEQKHSTSHRDQHDVKTEFKDEELKERKFTATIF